ncbi:tigger transposable element-derived protein 6-like [Euwallacea similis]|uniref:tigger transposable element-derived protein 6-like n=1 Tax=Euwallacea similis TaxID=1736056 RepID=UPI00344DD8DF
MIIKNCEMTCHSHSNMLLRTLGYFTPMCIDTYLKDSIWATIDNKGALIRAKAKDIVQTLQYKNFSASSGCLEKFRKRIIHIFNADETGLFFRTLPDKTLTFKREKCTDGKLSKERLTILHYVNMDGEKKRLLVIEELLRDFDIRMGAKRRKILLFLNNACSPPKDIQLVFLPPNCTSVVQPLDYGIIKNFKAFYRSIMVKNLLSKMEFVDSIKGFTKVINILDAVYFLKTAWQKVTAETIENCFRKTGITREQVKINIENGDDSVKDDLPLSVLSEMLRNYEALGISSKNLDDFINIDIGLIVERDDEPFTVDSVTQEETVHISDDSDAEPDINDQTTPQSYQQAICLLWFLFTNSHKRTPPLAGHILTDPTVSACERFHCSLIDKLTGIAKIVLFFYGPYEGRSPTLQVK